MGATGGGGWWAAGFAARTAWTADARVYTRPVDHQPQRGSPLSQHRPRGTPAGAPHPRVAHAGRGGGASRQERGARAATRGVRVPPAVGARGVGGPEAVSDAPAKVPPRTWGRSARTVGATRSLASINWKQKRKAEEQMAVIDSAEDSGSGGRGGWRVRRSYVDGSRDRGRMVFYSSSGRHLSRRPPPAVLSQPLSTCRAYCTHRALTKPSDALSPSVQCTYHGGPLEVYSRPNHHRACVVRRHTTQQRPPSVDAAPPTPCPCPRACGAPGHPGASDEVATKRPPRLCKGASGHTLPRVRIPRRPSWVPSRDSVF